MGSGKTSVAKHLASNYKLSYLDTDSHIESSEQQTISDIFKTEGEPYFRNLELKLAKKLSSFSETIISTGGGFILQDEISRICHNLGTIVYLQASPESIQSRLNNDVSRPLASNKESLLQLHKKRHPYYQTIASFTVNTDNKSIDNISNTIWNYYENHKS